jgi:hypothetical protein
MDLAAATHLAALSLGLAPGKIEACILNRVGCIVPARDI